MLNNYIKIAFRNLLRNRVFSLINVVGLGLGIAAFVFILEYVSLEKSVNQFHTNIGQMYRLLEENESGQFGTQVAPGWAAIAKERLPEIMDYCRFEEGIAAGIVQKAKGDASFREENIGYVEGNFFSFFNFPLISGRAEALKQPNTVFLSASSAKKYFSDAFPLGQTLTLYNQFGQTPYTVGGVFADMTDQSDIQYDLVFSLETLRNQANLNGNDWAGLDNIEDTYITTIFLTKDQVDVNQLEKKLEALRNEQNITEETGMDFRLQPAANLHLAASMNDPFPTVGNVRYVYILAGIALLILFIAWFNYVNLSTANALKRAGEVGVRKAIGATQSNLIGQFLGESLLTNFLGFGLSSVLIVSSQSFFQELIGKDVSLQTLSETPVWAYGLGMLLAGTLLSGLYTAWVLSNFKPIETLKGKVSSNAKGIWLRKGLVVGQFAISTCLILATIVIFSQLRYMQNLDLGIKAEQMLVISGPQINRDSSFAIRKSAFANTLAQQSFQEHGTSGSVPGRYYNFRTAGFTQPGSRPKDELKSYAFAIIGDRFLKTYGIPLVAGRNFTPEETAVEWNVNSKVLLNERAVAELGFKSPEEALQIKVKWDERYLDVIGIVKDYHHTSVQNDIDPVIFYPQNSSSYYSIRLTPEHMSDKVATLEKLYKSSFPGNPFEYFFVDDNYQNAYVTEQQYGRLFTTAALLAIFIACLGLFGLATFTVEARIKEIGVRKVLGASGTSVVVLLSNDFLKLVSLGMLIAAPVAAYFLHQWLQDFAARIDIAWWIYAIAALLAVSIACLTVGYQSVKAGLMNPVDSLRSE